MLTASDKVVKVSSETLMIGLGVFLILAVADRISHTTYLRDSYWALFALSTLVVAPTFTGLYHLARWFSKLQRKERVSR